MIRIRYGSCSTLSIVLSLWIKKLRERELPGIPIGNLTSQLFANVYMNVFDHFIKDVLRVKYYLRYTDDFIIIHDDPVELVSLLPAMRSFLHDRLALDLHPRKIILRKLRQGIDFLGYIVLPHYRLLRMNTRKRMIRRMKEGGLNKAQLYSYLGLLSHAEEYEAELALKRAYLQDRNDWLALGSWK